MTTTYGEYHLLTNAEGKPKTLGAGSQATTFLAVHHVTGHKVALKLFPSRGNDDSDAVFREANSLRDLQHPHIARYEYAGLCAEGTYIVLELCEGGSLEDLLKSGTRWSTSEVLRVGEQVARALGHAHDLGWIHRDLKPANLLLGESNGEQVVKIIDFGIATAANDAELGSFAGTPAYASPEQLRGEAVGPESDLYSLGICLWHLRLGRLPSHIATDSESAHLSQEAHPLNTLPPLLAAPLERLVAKEPTWRFAKASEAADELQAYRLESERGGEKSEAGKIQGPKNLKDRPAVYRKGDALEEHFEIPPDPIRHGIHGPVHQVMVAGIPTDRQLAELSTTDQNPEIARRHLRQAVELVEAYQSAAKQQHPPPSLPQLIAVWNFRGAGIFVECEGGGSRAIDLAEIDDETRFDLLALAAIAIDYTVEHQLPLPSLLESQLSAHDNGDLVVDPVTLEFESNDAPSEVRHDWPENWSPRPSARPGREFARFAVGLLGGSLQEPGLGIDQSQGKRNIEALERAVRFGGQPPHQCRRLTELLAGEQYADTVAARWGKSS